MQEKVKVAQSCPAFWDPRDYTVNGILQARILEWIAFPFSRGPSQPRNRTGVSCIAGGFFTNWAIREAFNAGDEGSVPGLGRSPGEGNGNPFQYSCLRNPGERSLQGYSPWGWKRVGHYLMTKPPPRVFKCFQIFYNLSISFCHSFVHLLICQILLNIKH